MEEKHKEQNQGERGITISYLVIKWSPNIPNGKAFPFVASKLIYKLDIEIHELTINLDSIPYSFPNIFQKNYPT